MCIIVVLISIILLKKRPQKLILATAHKTIWVAISSRTVSYIVNTRVIMPMPYAQHKLAWTFEALTSVCASTLGFNFFGLEVIRHRLKKRRWRNEKLLLMQKNIGDTNPRDLSISTSSDVIEVCKKQINFYAM